MLAGPLAIRLCIAEVDVDNGEVILLGRRGPVGGRLENRVPRATRGLAVGGGVRCEKRGVLVVRHFGAVDEVSPSRNGRRRWASAAVRRSANVGALERRPPTASRTSRTSRARRSSGADRGAARGRGAAGSGGANQHRASLPPGAFA